LPLTPDAFSQPRPQGRGRLRADQAPVILLCALLAAGCEVPNRLDLRAMARDASGAAAEARLPPPGLDRPTPNLASVPPIPERPDQTTRMRITQGLEQARAASETPVPERRANAPLTEPGAPGQPPIPARPPAPPRLSRATPIPWTLPAGATAPVASPAPGDFPQPGAVPAAPGAELLVPGAAPSAPAPDLLAPGAPPPPPPPALISR
jgi:hypothetical protein